MWRAATPVFDLATKKYSQKIPVRKCANWFAISSDGKYVAVTNSESNSVSIIDAKTQKVLSEIPVGKGPKRIDIANVPAIPSVIRCFVRRICGVQCHVGGS